MLVHFQTAVTTQSGPSVGTRERVCHAAVVGRSFEDGREILNVHSGIVFSGKHVRTLAEQDGACVAAELEKDVKDFQAGSLEFPAAEKVELIVVTCDGGRIQTRQLEGDSRWKEDKIGAVYDAIAQPNAAVFEENYEGAKALSKTYVATMKPWESFGWMLRVEAEKRGYLKAREKLFVADGARSIGEMRRLQFPDAIFILDWAHAAGHLAQCAQAIFGPDPKAYAPWYELHKGLLWEGQIEKILGELQSQSEKLGHPNEGECESSPRVIVSQNAYSYFPNNQKAMDYPTFRSHGWPIGSGVAEGAVKQFALRMKGSEKFWNISDTGTEEMLALCSLYHSQDDRWQQYWKKRAEPCIRR